MAKKRKKNNFKLGEILNRKDYLSLSNEEKHEYHQSRFDSITNAKSARDIESLTNETILDNIWITGTNDYQMRVPDVTKSLMSDVKDAILSDENIYNAFVDNLVNKIGLEIIRTPIWDNPLSKFLKVNSDGGKTIQEIGYKLLTAESYDQNDTDVLESNMTETLEAFHPENRRDRYTLTIQEDMIEKAFNSSTGLAQYLTGLIANMYLSATYDEYELMLNMFAKAHEKKPFYKLNVPNLTDINASASDIRTFSKVSQILADRFGILSAKYNRYGVPTATKQSEMIIMITPEVKANLNVEVLAVAFNMDKADIKEALIVVDKMPIENAQAIVTDTKTLLYYTNRQKTKVFDNGKSLTRNYYYHIHQTLGLSYMTNCVVLTTETTTALEEVVFTPTEFVSELSEQEIGNYKSDNYDVTNTIQKSEYNNTTQYQLKSYITGEVEPKNINIPNKMKGANYDFTIVEMIDDGSGIFIETEIEKPNQLFIDHHGYIHIPNEILSSDNEFKLKINAISTYDKGYIKTIVIDIV